MAHRVEANILPIVKPEVTGFNPDWPWPHPGETIADALEERGWTEADFAKESGLPSEQIRQLLSGKAAVTEPIAEILSRVLGSTARFWLAREAHYRSDLKKRLAKSEKPRDSASSPAHIQPGRGM